MTALPATSAVVPASTTAGHARPSLVDRVRHGFTPVALVLGPVVTTIGFTLHEADAEDHEEFLSTVGHHGAAWSLAHLLIPIGLLLFTAGFAGLLRLASGPSGQKGARFLVPGVVLGMVGMIATAIDAAAHGAVESALMNRPEVSLAQSEQIQVDYLHSPFVFPLTLLGMGMILGMLIAGIGLFRSRRVPRWAAVLVMLSPVGLMFAGAGAVAPLGAAPLLIGTIVVARVLLRSTEQTV
jgi:MFS family permease